MGGTVWGTGIYTSDSNIYRAAQQMGLLPGRFGKVDLPGMATYFGSTSNGITTNGYGNYGNSYCLIKLKDERSEKENLMESMKELYEEQMKKYNLNVYKVVQNPGMKCVICDDSECTHLCFPCAHARYCKACIKLVLENQKCSICNL